MGMLNKFFNKSPSLTRYEMIIDKGNGFYTWNGNLYQSDIVRSCIRPKAKAIGKLVPKHIRNATEGFSINPEPYIRFLLEDPNQSDIVRSCIRPKAKAIGKLVPKHIRNATEGFSINPEPYIRFLLEDPNHICQDKYYSRK